MLTYPTSARAHATKSIFIKQNLSALEVWWDIERIFESKFYVECIAEKTVTVCQYFCGDIDYSTLAYYFLWLTVLLKVFNATHRRAAEHHLPCGITRTMLPAIQQRWSRPAFTLTRNSLVLVLFASERWKAELSMEVGCIPTWFTCRRRDRVRLTASWSSGFCDVQLRFMNWQWQAPAHVLLIFMTCHLPIKFVFK